MSVPTSRRRAPDDTRQLLLEAAFEEFYRHGFQAGRLATIVERAGVTKGALYHHFPDKTALGYAVLEEVIREPILSAYLDTISAAEIDPLNALQETLRRRADFFAETGIALGCPLNNLMQEMSPLDEGFRTRVALTLDTWIDGFDAALRDAQAGGFVRSDVDTRSIAAFVVAAIEGSFGVAKNANSVGVLRSNLEVLANFLDTLRPLVSRDSDPEGAH